jgi:aminoglycoside phosphotransferase (APT) family kinase protein
MPDVLSIDAALVRRLIAAQFPAWAELPVRPVSAGGWDNRTFHLGDSSAAAPSRHTTMKHSAPSSA